ncbi:MAG: hypothetical protein RLZZ27_1058 [Actinomycetota bacterium]
MKYVIKKLGINVSTDIDTLGYFFIILTQPVVMETPRTELQKQMLKNF